MNREVFRVDIVGKILFAVIFSAILILLAFLSKKVWLIMLLAIPIVLFINDVKTKLVIENGMLRFERLRTVDEISLNEVNQFMTQTIVSSPSDSKLVHVVDRTGRTQFKFPLAYITDKNRRRFEEKVLGINGNVEFTAFSIETQLGRKEEKS
jgi:hypothetical protein